MSAAQFKAFIITFGLITLAGWFVMGKPALPTSFNFDKVKTLLTPSQKSNSNPNSKAQPQSSKKRRNPSPTKRPNTTTHASYKVGQAIDSYRGVDVIYNGRVSHVAGRNTTRDGYNLGLKYQCVEFAKRFYYEAFNHKMPDSYGHAKDYYDRSIADGSRNKARGMTQYKNDSKHKPQANDLCIIGPSTYNAFGHLFVITKVVGDDVHFIQQNPGQGNPSRGIYKLVKTYKGWYIDCANLVGWLRI